MRTKGTWKTPIEAEYCLNCGKPFIKYKSSAGKNRRAEKMAKVKRYGAITCSKKCSREFNYHSNEKRKILIEEASKR